MKRLLLGILMLISMGVMSMGVYAESKDAVVLKMNGQPASELGAPQIVNGRTMLPARALFEKFGFVMSWDSNTKIITAVRDDYTIKLGIDSNHASLNGSEQYLDQAATLIEGKTYVPVRFVSDAVGASISYDPSSKVVNIDTLALDKPVKMSNDNLNACIQKKIHKDTYTLGDLRYTVNLDLSRSGINQLDGIEYFQNLKSLNIAQNDLVYLDPLSKLSNLRELNASKNAIVDIRPITGLKNLETLDLRENKIKDFYPLIGMKSLVNLSILGNESQDYKAFYYVYSQYKNFDIDKSRIELPDYDTLVLKNRSSYDVPVSTMVSWVSADKLGTPTFKNEHLVSVYDAQKKALNNQLANVYDVLQMLQQNPWKLSNTLEIQKKNGTDEVTWTAQPAPEVTLDKRVVSSHGMACLTAWLLQGDYAETGLILTLTKSGQLETFNYVLKDARTEWEEKENGVLVIKSAFVPEYYSFSPWAYTQFGGALPETGLRSDFVAASPTSGILKTDTLKRYINYLSANNPNITFAVAIRLTKDMDPFVPVSVALGSSNALDIPTVYKDTTTELLNLDKTELDFRQFTRY